MAADTVAPDGIAIGGTGVTPPPAADRPPAVSFVGDTHLLHHARVFGELLARHDTKLLGRAATYRETQFFKLAPNFGIADRLQDFGVQPGDDVLRRAGGRQDREPRIKEEPGQTGFRD